MNCKALELDRVRDYPVRKKRKDAPHRVILVGIIRKRGRILIERRPEEGMLGGLWQFPGGLRKGRASFAGSAEAIIKEKIGLKVKAGKRLARVRHAYSHFHITLHAYECEVLGGRVRSRSERELLWVRLEETDSFPFPSVNRKVLRILRESLFTQADRL